MPDVPDVPGELSPKVWQDINEAVGDALGTSPPDPVLDRPSPGAPAHGTSPARLVPTPPGGGPDAQPKLEDNGLRYQMAGRPVAEPGRAEVNDLVERHRQQMAARVEAENRAALSRAMSLFHRDGSLMGEYAPMQAQSTTPDTVDALWWLSLPRAQAMWELGIDKDDDATYSRVRRDIEFMAARVVNRMLQTREVVPMVIRRKKRRFNLPLFAGGRLRRLKPILPGDLPPPGTPRNRSPK